MGIIIVYDIEHHVAVTLLVVHCLYYNEPELARIFYESPFLARTNGLSLLSIFDDDAFIGNFYRFH